MRRGVITFTSAIAKTETSSIPCLVKGPSRAVNAVRDRVSADSVAWLMVPRILIAGPEPIMFFLFRLIGRVIGFAGRLVVFGGVLVAVAAGTMYALFDADRYKQALEQHVKDMTGRTLSIDGPVELHLSLPPRITLNNVRVGN